MRLENDGGRKRGMRKLSDAIRSLISWNCDTFCSLLVTSGAFVQVLVSLSAHTDELE